MTFLKQPVNCGGSLLILHKGGSSLFRLGILCLALLISSCAFGQIGPTTPTKEYIHLNGQIVAVQNVVGALQLSPTSLAFGNQAQGTTSTSHTVTLSNTGSGAVTIASLPITGTNAGDFSLTTTCGPNLAVGANCTASVTFTPQALGSRSANITITDSAPGSPHLVALTGTGTVAPAAVQLSPANLAFGSQAQGTTSASQTLTISNTGGTALTISSIAISGANSADFSKTTTCGASLAAASHCTVGVTFTPHATGIRSATLTITDSAVGSPQSVALTGTTSGTAPPPTVLTTYAAAYGSPAPSFTATTVTLPLRAYNPGGASNITNFTSYLINAAGTIEFSIILAQNGASYNMWMYDVNSNTAPYPYLVVTPNGQTTAASVSLSGLEIVATRLALVGNEMQLDLTLSRSGTFSDQVTMGAIASGVYSQPWIFTAAAQWTQ